NGRIRKIDLPKSDVIQWRLEDGTLLTVRPSGTEPKIKYYILCHDHNSDLSLSKEITRKKISIIEQAITAMVDSHRI
ncbi:MAG TPA: phospho-sugar mutase, partial [Rectinema sp.]|nr:phospho-sugar mutase [Rectinema sp.]